MKQSELANLPALLNVLQESNIEELSLTSSFKVAGQVISIDDKGVFSFGQIKFQNEIFQICVQKKVLPEKDYQVWKSVNVGDWIIGSGHFFRTRAGELTFNFESLHLIKEIV